MMHTYRIVSEAGIDMGLWQGETAAEALLALHRDAGYSEQQVWLGGDGELHFDSDDTRELCGGIDDWLTEMVDAD